MAKLKKFKPIEQQEREDELRKRYGGMMSFTEVCEELGLERKATEKWLSGMTALKINGRLRFRVADIAEREYQCGEAVP